MRRKAGAEVRRREDWRLLQEELRWEPSPGSTVGGKLVPKEERPLGDHTCGMGLEESGASVTEPSSEYPGSFH